jgi:hypothetical protein
MPISARGQQTPVYKYDFDETGGTGTTVQNQGSAGTGVGQLIMTNGSAFGTNGTPAVAQDDYSIAGGGKSAGPNDYSFDNDAAQWGTTNGGLNGGAYSETGVTGSPTGTITTLGTLPVYTLSFWMDPTLAALGQSASQEPRVLFLGPANNNDIGTANTIFFAYDKPNLIYGVGSVSANGGSGYAISNGQSGANAAQLDPGWDFYALTYDGANLRLYEGDSTNNATLVQTTPDASGSIALGSTAWLELGNRAGGTRAFGAWFDDVQIFTSALSQTDVVSAQNDITAPVPEPAAIGLLGVGCLLALRRRRA